MTEILEFFSSIWQLFEEVTVPLINITFAQLWIGVFVVSISISILRPLLGIGAGAVNNISKGLNNRYNRNKREFANTMKSHERSTK